ncbi:dephospho-CoA kinase [Candidatus Clostridium radicumherbarum]|uniref:Dephospho-CoA kinase n=1 Tax=Candidatus Clostridium radicumherbarum TaxID=3381662 RepID=A0ABW8TS13_9CLOT
MIKVGLTGGIGSGKSTVSNFLKEKGIPIIDADIISRDILILYPEVVGNIRKEFGSEFFDDKGLLKRRELGNFVFKNTEGKLKLEALTIPYIIKEIFLKIEKYKDEGFKMCIVDAPTLIETGLYKAMDFNILVWVDLNTQIERVVKRDNLNLDDVKNRINAQIPLEDKKKYVNFIIDNRSSIEATMKQVDKVLQEIYSSEVRYET